jgi:ATP-dependent protease HslVU (ClpYQ) peptidase subunit
MSTIVAVVKEGVACIAADSMTCFGDTLQPADYDRYHDKVIQAGESFIGIVGSAAHQLVVETLLTGGDLEYDFSDRRSIFDTLLRMHPVLKERFYLSPKAEEDDPYETSHIDALIVNPNGIFGVFALREVFEYTRFWAVGSGAELALGAMYVAYDRLDSAQEIAAIGIQAGAEFNSSTALPMTTYTVYLEGN